MRETIVITSGYFDPIHVGHIEYLAKAKGLGDRLVVIINSDEQAVLKKGRPFMALSERSEIVRNLRMVDAVFPSVDNDLSVCKTIEYVVRRYTNAFSGTRFVFAKGGDRFSTEIPELAICQTLGIAIVDGLGQKIQSSSRLTGIGLKDIPEELS